MLFASYHDFSCDFPFTFFKISYFYILSIFLQAISHFPHFTREYCWKNVVQMLTYFPQVKQNVLSPNYQESFHTEFSYKLQKKMKVSKNTSSANKEHDENLAIVVKDFNTSRPFFRRVLANLFPYRKFSVFQSIYAFFYSP